MKLVLPFIAVGVCALVAFAPSNPTKAGAAQPAPAGMRAGSTPNVLVILIDDVGVEQLECYDPSHGVLGLDPGTNQYTGTYDYAPTPNITAIATEGVRFRHAFSSQICSPSRAQFHTGRYPFRNQIGTTVTTDGHTKTLPYERQYLDLPESEITIPEMLAELAPEYRSAYFGKWHLSREPRAPFGVPPTVLNVDGDHHPVRAGWPYYRGIIRNPDTAPFPSPPGSRSGGYTNYYYVTGVEMPDPSLPESIVSRVPRTEYITTLQRQDVEDWILDGDEPFCAVWSPTACHGPYEWPPAALHGYGASEPDECNLWLRFRAILESLDTEIGNLRAALDVGSSPTIWENTVVIVMGDNGTDKWVIDNAVEQGAAVAPYAPGGCPPVGADPCPVKICDFTDSLRFKGTPYVGGTNVPLIACGPVVSGTAGTVSDGLVDIVDIFDTIRDVAGIDTASPEYTNLFSGVTIDGSSMVPILDGSVTSTRSESLSLFYRPNGPWVARDSYKAAFTKDISGDRWRLIRVDDGSTVTEELYQLRDTLGDVDPLETTDVIGSAPGSVVTDMTTSLDALLP